MKDTSKHYTHKGYKIKGWFTPTAQRWYQKHAEQITGGKIVEIGVYGGASLLSIVDICKKNKTTIHGIDPWELLELGNDHLMKPKELNITRKRLKARRLQLETIIKELDYQNVHLTKDFSSNASSSFKDGTVDLIFIDGSHGFESVLLDLEKWWPKLKAGGIFGGDDWEWEGVQKAVNAFAKEHNLKVNAGINSHVGHNLWELNFS